MNARLTITSIWFCINYFSIIIDYRNLQHPGYYFLNILICGISLIILS